MKTKLRRVRLNRSQNGCLSIATCERRGCSSYLADVTAIIMHSVVLLSSVPILDKRVAKWLARWHPISTRALMKGRKYAITGRRRTHFFKEENEAQLPTRIANIGLETIARSWIPHVSKPIPSPTTRQWRRNQKMGLKQCLTFLASGALCS